MGRYDFPRNIFQTLLASAFLVFASSTTALATDRTIYLTFDDGPLQGTENVLSVLKQENVPAAMFMVGLHVETSPRGRELLAQAKALPLVTLGNHSYTHANNRYRVFYSNTRAVVSDMLHANQVLGLSPIVNARLPGRDVFRLPHIATEDLSINVAEWQREWLDYELVSEAGFYLYGWDFEWIHSNDGKPVQSVDTLVSEIDHLFRYNKFVRPGKMILLMHDEMFQDQFNGREKLAALIDALKQRGYAFGDIGSYHQ
ncbi:polysaccharide deacetylase family protein [Rhizobium sp. BK376]|uniref:polysaccharide deacetylase family protein n=1 Tax=Rhizobium sp. BK376 TaxID=2512149 RepID=UPI00104C7B25|nr:polysaccharide deacetylase family protein [Rhizobium sp. BK376]TCR91803.1 peptidoglycan/xylan/chitin deacetylase (PgdA/CDA1 family) [Rhizobium sp. BK376]